MVVFRTFSVQGFPVKHVRNRIDTKTAREKLSPRREPYWYKLQQGCYIGYRASTKPGGSWVARWRDTEGNQHYESLGPLSHVSETERFDEAQRQARNWLRTLGGATLSGYTIKHAIDDYIEHRKINNGALSATDARQRLYKHAVPSLGHIKLTKLTMQDVTRWRDSLIRISDDEDDVRKSKDGANKLLSTFKAALNLAYRKDVIGTDKAWRRVAAFKDVGAARKVFLSDEQIKALYQSTDGPFNELIKSALLTGARYGEIVNAKVEDFDPRHGTLHLSGKTGARDCYLSDTAIAHFKALAKDKLPAAYLHIREDGAPWGRAHQQRPMREAVTKAGLPPETTFYALRHTHISRALLAGVNIQVVAENCGTSIKMIEKHYGKFLKSDRRAMFNQVNFS